LASFVETFASIFSYIKEGRFELVSGGWVMPDEAVSHYHALIDQLIEGQTWIRENIGETFQICLLPSVFKQFYALRSPSYTPNTAITHNPHLA